MRHRLADLIETLDKDQALLDDLIDVFLEYGPQLLDRVRHALDDGDSGSLYRSAHTLKGSASTFGARDVVACALRIESEARANDFYAAQIDVAVLESEMRTLFADLAAVKDGSCA
jgi:HPt (histidine-containing phosphotransfer) domain-containing protein